MCLSPSGNFVWAGFSDGTLRVFDLSGRFDLGQEVWEAQRQKSSLLVPSTSHQRFGAVACQIHARGVHTDLLMQVTACGDYVFGGVPRGAIEVYAVNIKDLEAQVTNNIASFHPPTKNILDYIQVHVHADAKLKGLGASIQLQNASRPTYLLLTGRGIKNIHIWKFQPPILSEESAVWEQLYDTQTNGNTINFLSFYRNPQGKLWGISQSDTQRVRLWDLSVEESKESQDRPKRPKYEDVTNSQAALGIAGGYGICGGPTMYNQLSIVSLDNPKSIYNHTELALPGEASGGRQRRGDLKQVVNVATLPHDPNHALLELDDGSIVHYTANKSGRPKLETLTEEDTGIGNLPADFWCRTLCLGNPGVVVAAVSYYNPNTQLGHIEVRSLQAIPPASPIADGRALSRLCMEGPPASLLKTKKKKKKRKKETLAANSEESAMTPAIGTKAPVIPMSMDSSVKTITKKMKKAPSASIPASIEKTPSLQAQHPKTPFNGGETLTFQKKQVIPISKTITTTAPQVSPPSTITPAATDAIRGVHEAPSSEDSNKADRGAIAKFLKPKRVLHEYSESQTSQDNLSVPRKSVSGDKPAEFKRRNSDASKASTAGTLSAKQPKNIQKVQAAVSTPAKSQVKVASSSFESSLENVATLLVDMKSPKPKASKASSSLRDTEIANKAKAWLKRLERCDESLPTKKSRLLTSSVDAMGSFSLSHSIISSPLDRMLGEHRAVQVKLQKQHLQSATSCMRALVYNEMTPEGVRSELKSIIRSFEHILHDVLSRQKLELSAFMDPETGKPPLLELVSQEGAFDAVREIYSSLGPLVKRPPGRPKATTSS